MISDAVQMNRQMNRIRIYSMHMTNAANDKQMNHMLTNSRAI